MSPFFFGSSEAPLFGFYHPPAARPVRGTGIVICNPLGQEYLRIHRTLKRLAERLSDAGHHVLRFDYSGTGDSAGEGDEIALARWSADADEAAEELRAMSGVRSVSFVGVRLGSVVAAEVAARRDDVDAVVLWDPVVAGEAYLRGLTGDDGDRGLGLSRRPWRSPAPGDPVAAGGFPLSESFRRELAGVDLVDAPPLRARRVLLVSSEERPEYDALAQRLAAVEPGLTRRHRPGAEAWDNPGRMGAIVLVPAIVGTIARFFAEGPGA